MTPVVADMVRALQDAVVDVPGAEVHWTEEPPEANPRVSVLWARDGGEIEQTYDGGLVFQAVAVNVWAPTPDEADSVLEGIIAMLWERNLLSRSPDPPEDEFEIETRTYAAITTIHLRND